MRDGATPTARLRGPARQRGIEITNGEAGWCGACRAFVPEEPDPCLGVLSGVHEARCGHGDPSRAYAIGQRNGERFLVETPSALVFLSRLTR